MALCGLEETQTNNTSFNRVPRGIRSRTHTVYHADADNTTNSTESFGALRTSRDGTMVSCAAMQFALAHPRRFEEQPGLPRRLCVFWEFLIEGPLLIGGFLRNPYANAQYECGCPVMDDPRHTHIGLVRPGSAPAGTRHPTHITPPGDGQCPYDFIMPAAAGNATRQAPCWTRRTGRSPLPSACCLLHPGTFWRTAAFLCCLPMHVPH